MGSWSDTETTILERSILERIPERNCAGRICETYASILVRHDLATNASEFGNQLTLRDTRVAVAQSACDGSIQGRMGQCMERW